MALALLLEVDLQAVGEKGDEVIATEGERQAQILVEDDADDAKC